MKLKRVVILGSTGSVGRNACEIALRLKDRVEVVGLAAAENTDLLAKQAAELGAKIAVVSDVSRFDALKNALPRGCTPLAGPEGLLELARSSGVDLVFCSIIGTGGLHPVIEALKAGKRVALASKEVLVMAGALVMKLVGANGSSLIPVDSEHSAIFQCLGGFSTRSVAGIILTSSGGPFRHASLEEMASADFERAVSHPVWSMGKKISVDSATMMNKALEMVEAHYLFGCPADRISVMIHPQAVVHSLVEFSDGALLAQLSKPDMRFPIQYAFTYPERVGTGLERLDLASVAKLEFERPDAKRFPSLGFAYEAIRAGGVFPCVMNAANEIAYERFRSNAVKFTDIWKIIEKTMAASENIKDPSLGEVLEADARARAFARGVRV